VVSMKKRTRTHPSLSAATGSGTMLVSKDGSDNTATGSYALEFNTSGSLNTATGKFALRDNTVGTRNTATGFALESSGASTDNTAAGYQALPKRHRRELQYGDRVQCPGLKHHGHV
jgi:hypothetical protein